MMNPDDNLIGAGIGLVIGAVIVWLARDQLVNAANAVAIFAAYM